VADQVDLSIRQFVGGWRLFCAPAPSAALASSDGIEYTFSGVPIAFMNAAIVTRRPVSGEALAAFGRGACEWAAPIAVPWVFIVTAEALDSGVDADAALEPCGLLRTMALTGMIVQDVGPGPSAPEGLEVLTPSTDADCEAIFDINSFAYGMPFDAGNPVWGRRAFWKPHYAALGRVDGQPVCCATALMVDGHRYVALVATSPDSQRRGYADAVMRHALESARRAHADSPTFLHATDAGRPVYERMGYRPVAAHAVFMEKKFLGGH
jgi:GNAT superfamily N-acetyltransferase